MFNLENPLVWGKKAIQRFIEFLLSIEAVTLLLSATFMPVFRFLQINSQKVFQLGTYGELII